VFGEFPSLPETPELTTETLDITTGIPETSPTPEDESFYEVIKQPK